MKSCLTPYRYEDGSPPSARRDQADRTDFQFFLKRSRSLLRRIVASSVVDDIAIARWQILRFDSLLARQWELSLAAEPPSTVSAAIHRFNRQIDQLNLRVARLERRLKFIRANFPQESPLPVEDKPIDDEMYPKIETPIVVKDFCPETIAFLRRYHPTTPIIISPPDAVPKGPLF